MQNKHKKRICIVANALGGGGLERVAAMQSIYLSESNYKVFVVSNLDIISYPFKGELLNLGKLKNKSNLSFNRLKRFLILKSFIKKHKIDFIIDHRTRKRWLSEWLISNFLYQRPTIYAVHSYKVITYIPTKNKFLNLKYQSSKKIVTVSKAIEHKIKEQYGFTNVKTIYNPVEFTGLETKFNNPNPPFENYILWYGRLDDAIKNLKLLIDAFQLSKGLEKQYQLIILGSGPDEIKLKNYVDGKNLNTSIVFINHVPNPLYYVKYSKFVVLTSRFEGFPMVLPEALSCGVPVISVDCKSGPNEIIRHKFNGLLVINNDKVELSKAMNDFFDNTELYEKCKSNSVDSVKHLSVSEIKKQWINIIENE